MLNVTSSASPAVAMALSKNRVPPGSVIVRRSTAPARVGPLR